MNLQQLHNCEKSNGKLVMISADKLGVTRCGYCNEVVDYVGWIKAKISKEVKE